MTDSTTDPSKPQALPELPSFRGYGALIMAAIVFLFAAYVTWGIFTMDVPESAAQPGPKFYPSILVVLSYILVVLLVIDTLRKPSPAMNPVTSPHSVNTAAKRAFLLTLPAAGP